MRPSPPQQEQDQDVQAGDPARERRERRAMQQAEIEGVRQPTDPVQVAADWYRDRRAKGGWQAIGIPEAPQGGARGPGRGPQPGTPGKGNTPALTQESITPTVVASPTPIRPPPIAALLLLPPLLWLPLPLLRHATINAAASCVTTAVWGSRATSRGCLGQRLHSLVACLPDVRVDGVPACAWAIAKKTDAPTALGMSRRGARLASATSLSYRRAPRGQLMSRLRAVACAGMEQM